MRQLHRELVGEVDTLKREEILERMLFLIEANSRLQRLDEQPKWKAANLPQPVQDVLIVRDCSQTRDPREPKPGQSH